MSLIGEKQLTGSKGLVKRDYKNQKDIATGFKKLRVLDKPGLGATGINLASLTLPTEVTSFVNPSVAELAAAKLLFYKRNVVVKSTSKGELIQDISYRITSNTFIEFVGFTAEENEIFEVIIDSVPATGIQVVDSTPVIAANTLPAGQTEFVVGEPFELNKFPTKQIGAVMVFLDGALQFRNSSNVVANPSADGNYHEKSAGNQLSTIIEFNEVDNDNARSVVVVSTQGYAERPDGSMMALIEQIQATVDLLVEDAALGFGNPETKYQAQPTQPDLTAFGDRVFGLENPEQMSDELATRLGKKEYNGDGTDYTVTGANWTTVYSYAIPYQMQDGSWRVRMQISGTLSATTASLTLSISGVDFFGSTERESGWGYVSGGTSTNKPALVNANFSGNPTDILVRFDSTETFDVINIGGDFKLDSKPSWAV